MMSLPPSNIMVVMSGFLSGMTRWLVEEPTGQLDVFIRGAECDLRIALSRAFTSESPAGGFSL